MKMRYNCGVDEDGSDVEQFTNVAVNFQERYI